MDNIMNRLRFILEQAGLHCINALPKSRLPRLQSPMIAMDNGSTTLKPFAHNRYLGSSNGLPVLGDLAQTIITLDIYSPYRSGGQVCKVTADKILSEIASGLGEFNLTSIRIDPISYDPDADCFRSGLSLYLQGYRFWLTD